MVLKKVFLTGGTGTLGTELIKISREFGIQFVAPSSKTCDIRSFQSVEQQIVSSECDVVLHCAAATDVRDIENFQKSSVSACEINVFARVFLGMFFPIQLLLQTNGLQRIMLI